MLLGIKVLIYLTHGLVTCNYLYANFVDYAREGSLFFVFKLVKTKKHNWRYLYLKAKKEKYLERVRKHIDAGC